MVGFGSVLKIAVVENGRGGGGEGVEEVEEEVEVEVEEMTKTFET